MFARLALYTVRRRRRVLVGAVVAVMLAGGLGSGVIDALTTGGYAGLRRALELLVEHERQHELVVA